MLIDDLRKAQAILEEKHTFKRGDIVVYKDGMQNKKGEGPYIVEEVLTSPIFDESVGAGSVYFREPLDIILGEIADDGSYITYYYDSRRFRHYKR